MCFWLRYLPLFMLFFDLETKVYGFSNNCDVNQTLFVPEGSSATFDVEGTMPHFLEVYFRKYNISGNYHVYWIPFLFEDLGVTDYVDFFDPWMENRTEIISKPGSFKTILHNIEKADNGTYHLRLRKTYCYALFVIGVHGKPDGVIEEHYPAYFYGTPKASDIRHPIVNATMMWFVDGKNVSQDPKFLLQDGFIWIASVPRTMNGKNITYRAVMDNGSASEANYTVKVTYGPEAPLQFSPNKALYFLESGDTMPEVSCFVDCSPACTISWGKFGTGHILSLGKVSSAMTGDYVCTATRIGMDIYVNRTLTVHVTDNSAFTIAVAVFASIQAITTIFLGLCGIFIYRSGSLAWPSGLKPSTTQKPDANTTLSGNENNLCEIELEHYEVLQSGSGNKTPAQLYEQIQSQGSSSEQRVGHYINANIT